MSCGEWRVMEYLGLDQAKDMKSVVGVPCICIRPGPARLAPNENLRGEVVYGTV
jgi:hypothetical protein